VSIASPCRSTSVVIRSLRCSIIHAGASEFRKAFAAIKDGKPIRYVGVIGPVQFDRFGDITGPFRLWRMQDGQVATTGGDVGGRRRPPEGPCRRLSSVWPASWPTARSRSCSRPSTGSPSGR
jgi:hypothetical protein